MNETGMLTPAQYAAQRDAALNGGRNPDIAPHHPDCDLLHPAAAVCNANYRPPPPGWASPPGGWGVATAGGEETPPATTLELHAAVRQALPVLDWHVLWKEDPDEEEWIVEPLLPARRQVALYSAPKVGKSLLALEVAVAVSRGTSVLGVTPTRARRVLYVDLENDPRGDIKTRLMAMKLGPEHLDDLAYLSFPALASLDCDRGGRELLNAVEAYAAEVVIIDTLGRTVSGAENDNDTWLNFYRYTGVPLKRAGVALLRLDHSGKDGAKGQRGGSAKSGDVDAIWKLTRVTGNTYRLDCEDSRLVITEKTLVLHREPYPLRHRVDGAGRAGAFAAKLAAVIAVLDDLNLPADTGSTVARARVRAAGMSASNDLIGEAVRVRKTRAIVQTALETDPSETPSGDPSEGPSDRSATPADRCPDSDRSATPADSDGTAHEI